MIKHIAFSFLFFAFNFSFAQELTATQKLPATADANSEFTVEITVNRGQTSGFMKFFQPLPEDFTASEIDSKGGSFTFAENGAKIVWIAAPGELTYTFSYKVKVPATASGIKTFGGKLSYISNNERKSIELEHKKVKITHVLVVVKTEKPKTTTPESGNETKSKTDSLKTIASGSENETKSKTDSLKTIASGSENNTKSKADTSNTNAVTGTETKKETTAKLTGLPVGSNTPVTAIPSSPGRTYRVQIGAFNLKPVIKGVPEHTTVVLENGMTKHFSGNFQTYEEAVKRKKEMLEKGFKGAFIVSFENGKIIK